MTAKASVANVPVTTGFPEWSRATYRRKRSPIAAGTSEGTRAVDWPAMLRHASVTQARCTRSVVTGGRRRELAGSRIHNAAEPGSK